MTDTLEKPAADAPADLPETRFLQIAPPESAASESAGLAHQHVVLCVPGQIIASVTATAAPVIPQATVVPLAAVKLGRNVAWSGIEVMATKSGHVVLRDGAISVEESLELTVDIDAAMPIDFPGDVIVHGNVLDQAKFAARGNAAIHGAVEAAEVTLTGDLIVDHGICGKERGRVNAKGTVAARFVTNARITCGGDLRIQKEIGNSRLITGGQLDAGDAAVISSHITAVRGISCHAAGSTVGFRTILEIGLDAPDMALARKIMGDVAAERGKAQEIRTKVEPLLKNQKSLTPQQKEKATELLFLADEADAHAQQVEAGLGPVRAQLEAALAAEIRVAGTLHAGVVLRCLGYEATTTAALRGPVRITLKTSAAGAQFVIGDSHHHPMSAIPAVATDACSIVRQLQQLKA